ncbi:MAG TPA: acyltransferase family protein [Burkholderiaceae bacterium]
MHTQPQQRLFFLDWLRIGAFALLVLYHVGMYYVNWSWHVKSADASAALEPLMRLSSPWRLSLLFLISGAATSFMLLRDGTSGAWLGARAKRLLLPLLFGMAVIVPPQAYFEVVQQHGYAGSYVDFMGLYFSGYGGFCKSGGGCLILPTWNHLWFVAYLFVYSAALWGLLRAWPRMLDVLAQALARRLSGAALLWLPIAVLALLRVTLIGRFPPTHALLDDAYLHAMYFALFVVGAAWARDAGMWQRCAALRWPALGLAIAAWVAMVALPLWLGTTPAAREQWAWLARTMFAAMQWSAIVAAVGFARAHLNRDHRWRATLAESVFPVYIAHQTLIVLFAMVLKPLRWTPALEGPLLAALTLLASFGVYLAVRRVPWLRSVFGLQAAARAPITPAPVRVSAP